MSNKNTPRYFSDPKIVPRVKQYLKSHPQLKHVDVSVMADDLQNTYSEYRRKKRSAFLKSVKKAYATVSNKSKNKAPVSDLTERLESEYLTQKHKAKHKRDNSDDDDEVSFSSDDVELMVYEDTNAMNSLMSDCYKKTPTAKFTIDRKGTSGSSNASPISTPISTPLSTAISAVGLTEQRGSLNDDTAERGRKLSSLPSSVNDSSVFETPMKDLPTGQTITDSTSKDIGKSNKKRKTTLADNSKEPPTLKKPRRDIRVTRPTSTFADVGGSDACLTSVCKLLLHMKHPEIYTKLGVSPPRGLLLHGPPGCGKTLLANAIAGELELPFLKVSAPEIVKGVSGESEEMLRDLFEMATSVAPSIVFIDEIDAITPRREVASKDMERRIVAQLLTCLDDLSSQSSIGHVMVIGATNRADSLDPALRRAGRFDREICLGIPDESAREKIIRVLCRGLTLSPEFDCPHLAHVTPGYVGADLTALTREAAISAVNRIFVKLESTLKTENIPATVSDTVLSLQPCTEITLQLTEIKGDKSTDDLKSVLSWLKDIPTLTDEQLSDLHITMHDFEVALRLVQPSAKREGFATVPGVTWDDIGALYDIRKELQMAILAPVRYRHQFESLGLTKPAGILLYGPPGCGKTLLAKAIANESGINFISVKGPELLNMYVGESERAVRQVFQRASNSSPCVIFFDELDSLCPRRSNSGEGGSSVRVVNQMLTEMDGLEERRSVFLMAATNRVDIIDPAILRPGRLDKVLYVGLPSVDDRLDILNTITKGGTKPQLADDVSLADVAQKCSNFTGADLAGVVREASVSALDDLIGITSNSEVCQVPICSQVQVHLQHFTRALGKVKPSASTKWLTHEAAEKRKAVDDSHTAS